MKTLDKTLEPAKQIVSVLWKFIERDYDPATNQRFFLVYSGDPITHQHIYDAAVVFGIINE